MKKLLNVLANANRVKGGTASCDVIMQEFSDFLTTVVATNHSSFSDFNPREDDCRLDSLYYSFMAKTSAYKSLWGVTKGVLILSHGQADVESN